MSTILAVDGIKSTDCKCVFDLTMSDKSPISSGLAAAGENQKVHKPKITPSLNIPIACFFTSNLLLRLLEIARTSRPMLSSTLPGRLAPSSSSTFYVDPRLASMSMNAPPLNPILCIHLSPPPPMQASTWMTWLTSSSWGPAYVAATPSSTRSLPTRTNPECPLPSERRTASSPPLERFMTNPMPQIHGTPVLRILVGSDSLLLHCPFVSLSLLFFSCLSPLVSGTGDQLSVLTAPYSPPLVPSDWFFPPDWSPLPGPLHSQSSSLRPVPLPQTGPLPSSLFLREWSAISHLCT
jgi:hypothetical protein